MPRNDPNPLRCASALGDFDWHAKYRLSLIGEAIRFFTLMLLLPIATLPLYKFCHLSPKKTCQSFGNAATLSPPLPPPTKPFHIYTFRFVSCRSNPIPSQRQHDFTTATAPSSHLLSGLSWRFRRFHFIQLPNQPFSPHFPSELTFRPVGPPRIHFCPALSFRAGVR